MLRARGNPTTSRLMNEMLIYTNSCSRIGKIANTSERRHFNGTFNFSVAVYLFIVSLNSAKFIPRRVFSPINTQFPYVTRDSVRISQASTRQVEIVRNVKKLNDWSTDRAIRLDGVCQDIRKEFDATERTMNAERKTISRFNYSPPLNKFQRAVTRSNFQTANSKWNPRGKDDNSTVRGFARSCTLQLHTIDVARFFFLSLFFSVLRGCQSSNKRRYYETSIKNAAAE